MEKIAVEESQDIQQEKAEEALWVAPEEMAAPSPEKEVAPKPGPVQVVAPGPCPEHAAVPMKQAFSPLVNLAGPSRLQEMKERLAMLTTPHCNPVSASCMHVPDG